MKAVITTILLSLAATAAPAGDLDELLAGVRSVAAPGSPGPLCVFGPGAFPVLVDDAKAPAVAAAAAALGNGRLVALGHNGYFGADALGAADTARFMANLASWAGARTPAARRVVGLYRCPDVENALRPFNVRCRAIDNASSLNGISVLVLPANDVQEKDVAGLAAFVRRGGGVVAGVPGWGWLSLQRAGTSLAEDLPANRLFAPAGIAWADGSIEVTATPGRLAARPQLSKLLNASDALAALGAGQISPDDTAVAAATLQRAAQSLPSNDALLLPKLRQAVKDHLDKAVVSTKPGAPKPTALGRVALTFELARVRSVPPQQVKASPLAQDFPGPVPAGAARLRRNVDVDLSVPDWHATGLYAAPGEVVTVMLSAAGNPKLEVRIGCHQDKNWHHAEWTRAPEIDVVRPLAPGANRVAGPFGGLIYVVVPGGLKGRARVTIGNAVEAPRFVLGQTKADEWRTKVRNAPAPWAELESRKVVLTVPSEFVRKLDDPAALMTFWDRVADGAADLYQIPRDRPRAERFVADIQIGGGYMHSGYPIMTHLDAAPRMVDLNTLRTKGEWGLFHELGHNHQKGEWTFSGTGEVTNNLLPLYLLETVCEQPEMHENFVPDNRAKMERAYVAAGADFAKWQSEPFLALVMYQQLRDGFGWATYQKVFAEYRDLPDAERPKTDQEKYDQWMVRFSRAAGRNLAPFFQHWGIPTTAAARQSIANLPPWDGPAGGDGK